MSDAPLTARELRAIKARHEAGQPLRAFDQHAKRGTPADWAMARVFVEETTDDRARLLAALAASPAKPGLPVDDDPFAGMPPTTWTGSGQVAAREPAGAGLHRLASEPLEDRVWCVLDDEDWPCDAERSRIERAAPQPVPICGDRHLDSRYECVLPPDHPNDGPGLTSHKYEYARQPVEGSEK